jgi:hypothetical protein
MQFSICIIAKICILINAIIHSVVNLFLLYQSSDSTLGARIKPKLKFGETKSNLRG